MLINHVIALLLNYGSQYAVVMEKLMEIQENYLVQTNVVEKVSVTKAMFIFNIKIYIILCIFQCTYSDSAYYLTIIWKLYHFFLLLNQNAF